MVEQLTNEPTARKRVSGYDRAKRKNQYLQLDVAALESLVVTLLDHLETAIGPNTTSEDRRRIRRMVDHIRLELDQVEDSSPPPNDIRAALNEQDVHGGSAS